MLALPQVLLCEYFLVLLCGEISHVSLDALYEVILWLDLFMVSQIYVFIFCEKLQLHSQSWLINVYLLGVCSYHVFPIILTFSFTAFCLLLYFVF